MFPVLFGLAALILAVPTSLFAEAPPGSPTPISGTGFLPPPKPFPLSASKRQFQASFAVGDQITIPAFSFQLVGGGHYQTQVTCRLVGKNCYVFVEDEEWVAPRVAQPHVEGIARAFDSVTLRDPSRGIYDIETTLFGRPPDSDGDPRILLVLLDVLDSPITGVTFVGYYDVENQAPPTSREIIYLDTNPLDLSSTLALATLAHEFQHMLHWRLDPDEDKWLDEGASEYAELACGYKDTTAAATKDFLSLATNTSLTEWEDLPFDFDHAYLWTTYFVQRYGEGALTRLVADSENGIPSVNLLLEDLGVPERFGHLFGTWAAALYLDGPGPLGLERLVLGPVGKDSFAVPTAETGRTVSLWGVDFLALGDAPGVTIEIGSTGDRALVVTTITEGASLGAAPLEIQAGERRSIRMLARGNRALAITGASGSGLQSYSFSLRPIDPATAEPSDFDGNRTIGFPDFLLFAEHYNRQAGRLGFDPTYDLDGDFRIGFSDFLIFVGRYGESL